MNEKRRKLVVLVVDDSEIIIDRLVSSIRELENVGEVLYGFSYEEGKDLLEKNRKNGSSKINIALLDVNLPGNSGIDLLRKIRKENYPIQIIIMITEDPKEYNKETSDKLGANYFLNKYNDFEKLIDIIANFDPGNHPKK